MSGDDETSYYWNLSLVSDQSENWIAKWFLYHKFRYRDGRNRKSKPDLMSHRETLTEDWNKNLGTYHCTLV